MLQIHLKSCLEFISRLSGCVFKLNLCKDSRLSVFWWRGGVAPGQELLRFWLVGLGGSGGSVPVGMNPDLQKRESRPSKGGIQIHRKERADTAKVINCLLPSPAQDVIRYQGKLPSKMCELGTSAILLLLASMGNRARA